MTDITSVWTKSGWAQLAVVLDLFSRMVVGWSPDVTLSKNLVLRALRNAVQRSGGVGAELQHSDRGCAALRGAVLEHIAVFYNRRRLTSLNYEPPTEVERTFALANAA